MKTGLLTVLQTEEQALLLAGRLSLQVSHLTMPHFFVKFTHREHIPSDKNTQGYSTAQLPPLFRQASCMHAQERGTMRICLPLSGLRAAPNSNSGGWQLAMGGCCLWRTACWSSTTLPPGHPSVWFSSASVRFPAQHQASVHLNPLKQAEPVLESLPCNPGAFMYGRLCGP
jgi:hypothetical protein